MDKVKSKIDPLLIKILEKKKRITPEKRLSEDLGFTSLQLMELISDIEDEFDILVPVNDTFTIKTVGDLYQAIEKF